MFGECEQRRTFLVFLLSDSCPAKHNYRTVIHRMMKSRTRQYKTINQRDCHANVNSIGESTQHTTGLRAMDVKGVANSRNPCRDHEGFPFTSKAYMSTKSSTHNL